MPYIDKKLAKKLWKYRDTWVALSAAGTVIANGKDLKEVHRQVNKKGITDYVFHLVPSKPLAMAL
jgi:hypothetical protein